MPTCIDSTIWTKARHGGAGRGFAWRFEVGEAWYIWKLFGPAPVVVYRRNLKLRRVGGRISRKCLCTPLRGLRLSSGCRTTADARRRPGSGQAGIPGVVRYRAACRGKTSVCSRPLQLEEYAPERSMPEGRTPIQPARLTELTSPLPAGLCFKSAYKLLTLLLLAGEYLSVAL
jgi:hypothetical protein